MDDRPPDPQPTPLDYATPPPLRSARRSPAWARFAGGAAVVVFGSLALAYLIRPPNPRDDADPVCLVVGLTIELAVVAGVFWLGQFILARRLVQPLAERSRWRTVAAGAATTLGFGLAAASVARPTMASGFAIIAVWLAYLLIVAVTPRWLFTVDN